MSSVSRLYVKLRKMAGWGLLLDVHHDYVDNFESCYVVYMTVKKGQVRCRSVGAHGDYMDHYTALYHVYAACTVKAGNGN